MSETLLPGYADKLPAYYANAREELLPFIPDGVRKVLDVGCGAGAFGKLVRETRSCKVWGVEPSAAAAALARQRLDGVSEALFAPGLVLPEAPFDLICFNDVLEHMAEPEHALRFARGLLERNGRVLVSVPNFRHFNNLWELVVRGEATYRDSGVMDRTHLRVFTAKSIRALFEANGFEVERIAGITPQFTRRLFHLCNALTFGRLADTRWLQIAVVARPRADAGTAT